MNAYLQTPDSSIWQLADSGDAFVWSADHSTIALAAEVAAILGPLRVSLGGLPSLTATLFIIAAMRAPDEGNHAERHHHAKNQWKLRLARLSGYQHTDDVANFLISLAQLPDDMRMGIDAVIMMLQRGLEDVNDYWVDVTSRRCDDALGELQLPLVDRQVMQDCDNIVDSDNNLQEYPRASKRGWETLVHLSLVGCDVDPMRMWKSIGLNKLFTPPTAIQSPDLPLPREPINHLLRKLIENPQTEEDQRLSQLARCSRNVASLLTLPRRPSDHESLPIGGVSDVTNRGTPERLLMSELASDPLLLLARIANNQALYTRRESPPTSSPTRRAIAIESGIRCWGSTRVRLAAMALAIGAAEERHGRRRVEFVSVSGQRVIDYDLTNRDDLIEHLSMLETAVHPGPAIVQWMDTMTTGEMEVGDEFAEPMIVVSNATDRDASFWQSLVSIPRPFLMAIVDRDGTVIVCRRTKMGCETLQRLTLELPELANALSPNCSPRKPLFMQQTAPPLAFSPNANVDWCVNVWNDQLWSHVFLVTTDERLLVFESKHHGARELIRNLPPGQVRAHQWRSGWLNLVIVTSDGSSCLVRYHLDTDRRERVPLAEHEHPQQYAFIGGMLLCFSTHQHQVVRVHDGNVMGTRSQQQHHLGNGFVRDDEHGISRHGGADFEDWYPIAKLTEPRMKMLGCVVTDKDGVGVAVAQDLSWIIHLDGSSTEMMTGTKVDSIFPPQPMHCDPSGRWWFVRYETAFSMDRLNSFAECYRIDTQEGTVCEINERAAANLLWSPEDNSHQNFQRRSVRRIFQFAAMTGHGFVLYRTRRVSYRLTASDTSPRRLTLTFAKSETEEEPTAFTDEPGTENSAHRKGWQLRVAQLQGGCAWLDTRGLIHLQREDDPRELTLCAVDQHVAGWFSETGFFGARYFSPFDQPTENDIPVPQTVLDWLEDWRKNGCN